MISLLVGRGGATYNNANIERDSWTQKQNPTPVIQRMGSAGPTIISFRAGLVISFDRVPRQLASSRDVTMRFFVLLTSVTDFAWRKAPGQKLQI